MQTFLSGGQTFTTIYDIDPAGCLTGLTYPSGTKLIMTCDRKGRTQDVKRVISTTPPVIATIASNITYHPSGRPASMDFGNGRSRVMTMLNGRVKSIVSAGVVDLTYTWDGAANLKNVIDAVNPARTVSNADYDKLNRLIGTTTAAGAFVFDYDDLGNRTLQTVPGVGSTNYVYNSATNRLDSSNGPSAPPPLALSWNVADRIEASSDGATYRYDGMGRRIAKQVPSANIDVLYHYDVGSHLLAETLPNGTVIREYFYVGDQPIAVDGCVATSGVGCGDRNWLHTDHVGNVVARTDRQGAVVSSTVYTAYGTTPSTTSGSRLYNARVFDPGTGFYDFGARYYSPELGRFLSADRVWPSQADPQYGNMYAFGLNNPYKYTDPQGELPFLVVTGAVGAVIGGVVAGIATYDSERGVDWSAVGVGVVGGAIAGATLGAATGYVLAGSALAETSAVSSGAIALATGTAPAAPKLQELASNSLKNPMGPLEQAALRARTINQVASVVQPNRIAHIFGQAKHGLDGLVARMGSQHGAYEMLDSAVQAQVRNGILGPGRFETIVNIVGYDVTVRGAVIDGTAKIGTAFIP